MRSYPATCGGSCLPGSRWPCWAPGSPSSTTPSTRSETRPCGRPGGGVTDPLLEVKDLTVDYQAEYADVRAVDHVSLSVAAGEFLGVVGESGCGKSTLLFAIAQLLSPPAEITSGRVVFRGQDLVRLSHSELRHVGWRDYSVVMQSAMNALNPMKSIGAQFKDTMRAHERISADAI